MVDWSRALCEPVRSVTCPSVKLVPFQCTATLRKPLPFGPLTNGLYSPTAVHLFAAAQLTPFKYPFVSDGGYGVETAVHCVPSQRNALRPTAMHAVIDVHETLRTWSMAGGTDGIVQATPSHCSMRVSYMPDATHHDGDTHDTDIRCGLFGWAIVWSDHACPSQRSATVREPLA